MTNKERFLDICHTHIKREGLDKVLDWLEKSDFYEAPASTKFHGNYAGGLLEHSLNVYDCMKRVAKNYPEYPVSDESIAICALFHDVCKVNFYQKGYRNVKDEKGVWQRVDTFEYDDQLPYGHGEKSVYIISGYMKLTREEAFAIRYHMGYSSTEDARNVSAAFEMFPLAFALSTADSEATYYIESDKYKR